MNSVPSKAKLKLLAAAAELFAERGFDAVSVRDVTQRAKANVAAVNYHFGSREEMVAMVMVRCLDPILRGRLDRLAVLEKKRGGKAVAVEEWADAYVRPLLSPCQESDLSERAFCSLAGRTMALPAGRLPASLAESQQVVMERYFKALSKSLPSVPKGELWWRVHFMNGALVHLLSAPVQCLEFSRGESGEFGLEAGLSRFIHHAVAGLREGVDSPEQAKPKGPQATFDF